MSWSGQKYLKAKARQLSYYVVVFLDPLTERERVRVEVLNSARGRSQVETSP